MDELLKKVFLIFISGFILATLSTGAIAAPEKLINLVCPINKQHACSAEGCNDNPPSVTIKIQKNESGQVYYSRCDKKGCDRYESSMIQPGAYIEIVPLSGNSSRLKINSEDLSFMETTSLGLVSLVGFGKCQEVLAN